MVDGYSIASGARVERFHARGCDHLVDERAFQSVVADVAADALIVGMVPDGERLAALRPHPSARRVTALFTEVGAFFLRDAEPVFWFVIGAAHHPVKVDPV